MIVKGGRWLRKKKKIVCRLCFLITFFFLLNSENSFTDVLHVKYEILNFLVKKLKKKYLFLFFQPLLWTIRPCFHVCLKGCLHLWMTIYHSIAIHPSAVNTGLALMCNFFILLFLFCFNSNVKNQMLLSATVNRASVRPYLYLYDCTL